MPRQTTPKRITALYPRLSHDDEKTNRRKAKLFLVSMGNVSSRKTEQGQIQGNDVYYG